MTNTHNLTVFLNLYHGQIISFKVSLTKCNVSNRSVNKRFLSAQIKNYVFLTFLIMPKVCLPNDNIFFTPVSTVCLLNILFLLHIPIDIVRKHVWF